MKKQEYQKLANKICLYFEMASIPIIFHKRKSRNRGKYYGNKITLNIYDHHLNRDTLFHELAHHLHQYRYGAKQKGYYTMEMWPSTQPSKDKPGWFVSSGPLKPVYFIGSVHGKAFKQCYSDILIYYRRSK